VPRPNSGLGFFLCPPVRGISAHVSGYPDTHRNRYGMKASTDPHFQ
jgi:hypothetical protein